MTEGFFQQLIVIMTFSLLAAIFFQRLKMSTIIAYMAVGAAIGPQAFNFVSTPESFSLIAEFGVVFLLFSLGLEFSLPKMLSLKFLVFGVGGVQVLACTIVFGTTVYFWGSTPSSAVLIAGALALSSTAIVTRELVNTHQLHNQHGKLAIGVLLFQDLVAVIFLIMVPVLANQGENSLAMELASAILRGVVLFSILMVLGKWVLPLIYKEVALSKSEEIFVLSTLVIVLLAAWLTHSFHLSMALGGFVTGMMLGEGSFKYQIENDIRPFKDILLGLFFVTIGMSLDLGLLIEYWPRIILFTLLLILIKTVVVTLVVKAMGFGDEDAIRVGLTLAQAGEFCLALMSLAYLNGVIPLDQSSFIILIAIFTMALSPVLIRNADLLTDKFFRFLTIKKEGHTIKLSDKHHSDHVIIGGFGRVGMTIAELLEQNEIPYIAIDNNIEQVNQSLKLGKNLQYGDCTNIDLLMRCHLTEARLAVLTFKSLEHAKTTISKIRKNNPDIPVIVRCSENANFQELLSLGANHVFLEMLESSMLISRQVLTLLKIDGELIQQQLAAHKDQYMS
ncbi:MAG: cation:proton antiporter [Gammaproteobacteria bacterium]